MDTIVIGVDGSEYSAFALTDVDTGRIETCTLVFPDETNMTPEGLAVMAPVDAAVLGRRVGDEVEGEVPAGVRRFRVNRVFYRPEAARDRGY